MTVSRGQSVAKACVGKRMQCRLGVMADGPGTMCNCHTHTHIYMHAAGAMGTLRQATEPRSKCSAQNIHPHTPISHGWPSLLPFVLAPGSQSLPHWPEATCPEWRLCDVMQAPPCATLLLPPARQLVVPLRPPTSLSLLPLLLRTRTSCRACLRLLGGVHMGPYREHRRVD